MNNRILQLAKQAGYVPLEPRAFADDLHEIFLQKFAELVIQDFVSRLKSDTNEWVNTLGISDQNEINKIYESQLARQLDEEWYWAIK